MQIREWYQNIDFAVVLGHATESALSKAKLLLDQTKLVLNLGPDVSLSRFNQIQQVYIRGVG